MSSCDNDPTDPSPVSPSEQVILQWEHPFPVVDVEDVWGAATDDVHAVGAYGQILHYDGDEWTYVNSPTRAHLLSMWGLPTGDIWAVGWAGAIVHFDGREWRVQDSGTQQSLFGVWASSPDTVLAVGWDGTVLRYDGGSWNAMTPPTTSDLLSIWGTSAHDLYVGARDALLHFDGTMWTDVGIQVRVRVIGIWGSSTDDVWVTDGTNWLWHFDGTSWQNVITRVNYPFVSFWGFAADNIFACGQGGFVSRFDGTSWSEQSLGDLWLSGLWGASDKDMWVTGTVVTGTAGVLFHYDGTEWTQVSRAVATRGLQDIWSNPTGDMAYAVGFDGQVLAKNNAEWEAVPMTTSDDLEAVWGAPSGDVFVAASSGTCYQFDGSTWHETNLGASVHLTDVWGTSGTNVFVGSNKGLWRFDGSTWSLVVHGYASGVWGTSESDVYAVGIDSLYENGSVEHFNGSVWSGVYNEPATLILSVAGTGPDDVVIIERNEGTNAERLLKYNGASWDDISPLEVTHFEAIGGNPDFGLVTSGYNMEGAAVTDHALLRLIDGHWEPISTRYSSSFLSIWGGIESGVYLLGGSAIVRGELE